MEELLLIGVVIVVVLVGPILGIRAFFVSRRNSEAARQFRFDIDELRTETRLLKRGVGDDVVARIAALEARLDHMETRGTPLAPEQAPAPLPPEEPVSVAASQEPQEAPAFQEQPLAAEEILTEIPTGEIPAAASTPAHEEPAREYAAQAAERAREFLSPSELIDKFSKKPSRPLPDGTAAPRVSFEMMLGGKWLNWAGALMLLIGIGYGLKYMYDNSIIGPQGRLMIAAGWGTAALIAGEHFRRKNWSVMFQTFTGIGLAIYYLAVFFSFQVYHLSGPMGSFGAAVAVSALAIALAVAHNALPIAILAVVGGFLSPVLLSTGENRPYALFTYIAILDLIAIGAAYFRRWRALEVLCFAGTALMFAGWHARFWNPDGSQLQPALIYISLFYLMFLLIPTLYSLARRLPETPEGIVLVIGNAVFWLAMYYRVLYPQHRQMLGFFVLGQSLLVFLLFRAWATRVSGTSKTAQSLLIIALGLVTLAIPLHLKMYGIPLAWAVEGVLFTWAGIKFNQRATRLIGLIALLLSTWNLLQRLPLHSTYFLPIINVPFGSWMFVAAACALSAYLLRRAFADRHEEPEFVAAGLEFLVGFALVCLALSLETMAYWKHVNRMPNRPAHAWSSLIVLWSVIPLAVSASLRRIGLLRMPWKALAGVCYGIGAIVLLVGFDAYRDDSRLVVLNGVFITRMAFIAALWLGARIWTSDEFKQRSLLESLGHVFLAVLIAVELNRWGKANENISQRLTLSLVSAAWALQALVLIWLGLVTRMKLRRHLGFVLFAVVIAKVLFIDTSQLEKAYRIISFMATGVLLLAGGYFYHRYSEMLKREEAETDAGSTSE